MEEFQDQNQQLDVETMVRQFEYNESNTIRYAKSATRFCEAAERLKEKFLEDFECWCDLEHGDVHYWSKNERVDLMDQVIELFPFDRCCDSLYVSGRAASLQNEDVKEFNGIRLRELSGAIQAVPRDSLLLGRAYELFDSEVKFLRLLVNSREGINGDESVFVTNPDVLSVANDRIDEEKPQWFNDERSLKFRGQVVREFAPQTGGDVLKIVKAFEECEWPTRIDDPLSPPDAEKTKLALRTINVRLIHLRFSKDGDGIKWEVTPK